MKKLLLALFLFVSFAAIAQEDTEEKTKIDKRIEGDSNYNELKINGLYAIVGAFELSYERTLNKRSAIGFSALYVYEQDRISDLEYYFGPYYRYYFGKRYASGFFLEGFGLVNSSRQVFLFLFEEEFQTDFALGIGFGGKWVSESGFVGELNLGFGRNLFNNENDDFDLIGRLGITIGYRF
jgi:hypothetical protein